MVEKERPQNWAIVPGDEVAAIFAHAFNPPQVESRRERRALKELRVQEIVIAGTAHKTDMAQRAGSMIQDTHASLMGRSIDHVFNVRNRLSNPEAVAIYDQLVVPGLPQFAQSMYGFVNTGWKAIGEQIPRSLYPETRKRGFVDQLFGRDED